MTEREMEYRGSKSATGLYIPTKHNKPGTVKEQRVDGSWRGKYTPRLRCTLTGSERNYQVKILSNQKNKLRSFTTTAAPPQPQMKLYLLNTYFVTGFIDAEGCFLIRVRINPKSKIG